MCGCFGNGNENNWLIILIVLVLLCSFHDN